LRGASFTAVTVMLTVVVSTWSAPQVAPVSLTV